MSNQIDSRLTIVSERLSNTGYFLGQEIDSKEVKATDLYAVAAELEDMVAVLLMTASQIEKGAVVLAS